MSFNPDLTSSFKNGIFGIACQPENAQVTLIPVPWEVTVSYGGGAALGPEAILKASPQLDLFDIEFGPAYEKGIVMHEESPTLCSLNQELRLKAQLVINELEQSGQLSDLGQEALVEVNKGSQQMSQWVYQQTLQNLEKGKLVGIVGGDHSSPLGAIKAIGEKYRGEFAILHIDAHADLRKAYQGFEQSHASIMYNVTQLEWAPSKIVSVGIRDFCKQEFDLSNSDSTVTTFYDQQLKADLFVGKPWKSTCEKIIEQLPNKVYISFDIDGLSPDFCPNTGTPVPGGLSYDQAMYLIAETVRSGRKIIGFDLCEVAPDTLDSGNEWDANVGARVLYKLCGWSLTSNGQI